MNCKVVIYYKYFSTALWSLEKSIVIYKNFAAHHSLVKPTCKANGYNNEFGPERPLKISLLNLVSCPLYQDVEAPDDAGDGHQVEGDVAAQLPPLQRTHVQLLPLSERFHLENIQTEFFSISWGALGLSYQAEKHRQNNYFSTEIFLPIIYNDASLHGITTFSTSN